MNIETIPDTDLVSRFVDSPRMYGAVAGLIWPEIFQFAGGNHESVVWRKYAPGDRNVHTLGCLREANQLSAGRKMAYVGFISADVGKIRAIRSNNGHGFAVSHLPDEGPHHAGIDYCLAEGTRPLGKAEKADLRMRLATIFGRLVGHSCASPN